MESKLETVRSLQIRIRSNPTSASSVHEALHGKPLNEVLTNLAKEIDPTFKLEKDTKSSKKKVHLLANLMLRPFKKRRHNKQMDSRNRQK